CSFSLRCFGAHWHPLPFPTRRSSDLSLRTTDFYLIDRCGFPSAVTALYGDEDQRAQYFDGLRWSGGDEAVLEALKREEDKIQELGRDPAHQADYIKAILDKHVSTYRAARQNGGETFPDFVG